MQGDIQLQLKVTNALLADCDKGIVRIHHLVRGDSVERGQWCELSHGGRAVVVRVFGTKRSDSVIQMDLTLRKRLHVDVGQTYSFRVRPVGPLKEVWHGWRQHPDVGIRISSVFGLLGLLMGGIGLLLGVVSIFLTICH